MLTRCNIRFCARYDETGSELLSLQHCKLTLAVDVTPEFSLHREHFFTYSHTKTTNVEDLNFLESSPSFK